MVKNMKVVRASLILLYILCSLSGFSQGAYLDKGENGFGAEVRAIWSPAEFKGVGFTGGYSIGGILDVGLRMDYSLGELSGSDSTELSFGFDYNVIVVKQSDSVPLSLQILGSYALTNVTSDYLEANDLVRRATGYTIGLSLGRDFRLTSYWRVRLTGLLDYHSATYTDTRVEVDSEGDYVMAIVDRDHVADLYFGGGLGFLFVFPNSQTLAVQAELRADQDLDLQIHPIVAVAFPRK